MNHRALCAIVCAITLFAGAGFAQPNKVTIEKITDNPGAFNEVSVEVEGLVNQYVAATSTSTSYYLLRGAYGGVIKVNTSEPAPEINQKYRVGGIVYIDPATKEAFISEKFKTTVLREPLVVSPSPIIVDEKKQVTATISGGTLPYSVQTPSNASVAVITINGHSLSVNGTGEGQTLITIQDASTPVQLITVSIEVKGTLLTWLIGGIVLLLLLLIVLLVYFLARRKRDVAGDSVRPGTSQGSAPPPVYSTDFKTIKIVASPPKTLVFIPGQLVITSGEDKGKSFRIAGFPTPEGNIVTIGREVVTGQRAYAHVQLDNRFMTVSARQAEIIVQNGHSWVRNLSETNFTQVDGVELKPGEKKELKPNTVIRTGELEFQYKV